MSRIEPRPLEEVPQFKDMLLKGAETMGFLSDDGLIMAHCPEMLAGTGSMINSILFSGSIDGGLKRMIGYLVSQSSGCQYCSAHTSFTSAKHGISESKMKAIWNYQSSPLFTDKEKAALQLAHHAGTHPNAATDEDFELLKAHFNTQEIVEIVFTISLYGFLNKFNDTMKTTIEDKPLQAMEKIKGKNEIPTAIK